MEWCVCLGVCLTIQAAWTASDRFPASGSHQNTWHSKRCVPPSTITAKVWLSWPTPRKVRKRTWHSQKGSSPSCQGQIGVTDESYDQRVAATIKRMMKRSYLSLPQRQNVVGDVDNTRLPLVSVGGIHDALDGSVQNLHPWTQENLCHHDTYLARLTSFS